jgi:predicted transposase/invertase (TIGR01784 family)
VKSRQKVTASADNSDSGRNLIRFDWAIKRLLRNKANYKVLEGFLSELLHQDVIIRHIGESEGNSDDSSDKFNRVDILVENYKKELFIIELQNSSEADYFSRMIYGVARAITNHIHRGDFYKQVRKVYSINIVYFDIGQDDDYVYHGTTEFLGIHQRKPLRLSVKQQKYFSAKVTSSLFPEFYVITVNGFNDVAKNRLDEWIYYLKNDSIPDSFKAKGLSEAREILQVDNLNAAEKEKYMHHVSNERFEKSVVSSAIKEGIIEGQAKAAKALAAEKAKAAKALAEEKAKAAKALAAEKVKAAKAAAEKADIVLRMAEKGMNVNDISDMTGLPASQVADILREGASAPPKKKPSPKRTAATTPKPAKKK